MSKLKQNNSGFVSILAGIFILSRLLIAGNPILVKGIQDGQFPRWSPKGSYIAYTGPQYKGIYLYSIKEKTTRTLTDEPSAGFGMEWSPKGDQIASRVSMWMNDRQLFAFVLFPVSNKSPIFLTDYHLGMSGIPCWNSEGTKVWLNGSKKIQSWNISNNIINSEINWVVVGNKLIQIMQNGQKTEFPLPEEGAILEPDIASDNQHIVLKIMGGNLWILSADHSPPVNLGYGDSPRFSPDNNRVCYTIIKDDGHRITESDIYIASLSGDSIRNVSQSPKIIELHPDWSPDGTQIVYDTNDGMIWTMEVSK